MVGALADMRGGENALSLARNEEPVRDKLVRQIRHGRASSGK